MRQREIMEILETQYLLVLVRYSYYNYTWLTAVGSNVKRQFRSNISYTSQQCCHNISMCSGVGTTGAPGAGAPL